MLREAFAPELILLRSPLSTSARRPSSAIETSGWAVSQVTTAFCSGVLNVFAMGSLSVFRSGVVGMKEAARPRRVGVGR